MNKKYTIDYIEKNGLILLKAIAGSNAHGTNIETSDIDIKGIYICELEDLYSGDYPYQISDVGNDVVYYEIGRFLELLQTNNPTIIELMYVPEDCVISINPVLNILLENKDKFISKICKNSFGGYARQQIKKAKGMKKKQNWEKDKIKRKDILDFCYVIEGSKTIAINKWFKREGYHTDAQKFCGVVNIPNARDVYALFFDAKAYRCFSEVYPKEERELEKRIAKSGGGNVGIGYKGIVKVGGSDNLGISNQLRLSSVPNGENVIAIFTYNKDGYTQHCKDYKEYQEWLNNRNTQRWVDVKGHNQKIDGKNMLHCVRLIDMSVEIAEGKGVIVRRPYREKLLDIRKGNVSLEEIIKQSEIKISKIDSLFDKSDLPDIPETNLGRDILIKIRTEFYNK